MNQAQLTKLLQRAEKYFRSKQYKLAKVDLEHIIQKFPTNSKANELLANLYRMEGNNDLAYRCFSIACKDKNCSSEALYYLAAFYIHQNLIKEAVPLLEASLNKAGDYFEALHDLGVAQTILGDKKSALNNLLKALSFSKNSYELLFNIAKTYDELKDYERALEFYSKVIEINPSFAQAWSNRGIVLNELCCYKEALTNFDEAIKISPDYFEAITNKSITLIDLKLYDQAIKNCDEAILINKNYALAYCIKGKILSVLKDFESAYKNINRAILLKPDDPELWLSRAVLHIELNENLQASGDIDKALSLNPMNDNAWTTKYLKDMNLKHYQEAMDDIDKALEINPKNAQAWFSKGNIYIVTGKPEQALEPLKTARLLKPKLKHVIGYHAHSKLYVALWEALKLDLQEILHNQSIGESAESPFAVLSLIDDPKLHLDASISWAQDHLIGREPTLKIKYNKHKKIRIGYFSPDFKNHPVSLLTAELFELHDREKFEIMAFSLEDAMPDDLMRRRLISAFDKFMDVSNQSEIQIAQLARNLEIDIAIDLGGHTLGARPTIFYYRAAPIQISYVGYLGTMGAECFDYLIADKTIIPPESQVYYSEKIIYLPSYQVNDRKRKISNKVFTREELGLPQSGFVFACFNNSYKILPATFDGWMRILKAVEGSVLFLYSSNTAFQENIQKEAQKRGVEPQRIVFGQRISTDEYLARYQACNLFLDTLPYNAGATASDALWVGLPVLTLIGKSFPSRYAASLLVSIELPELIAHTQAEYEAIAIGLAINPEKLQMIKNKLADHRVNTILFNTPQFTKHLESAYTKIYNRYHEGLPTEHIYIEK